MSIKSGFVFYICLFICCCTQFSCIPKYTIKNYPVDTPFVFDNKIILKGNLTKEEKAKLNATLVNYWADSMYAPRAQQLGFFYIIKNPPIFDSIKIPLTEGFMKGYLKSQGYYYAQMHIVSATDSVPDRDYKNYVDRTAKYDSATLAFLKDPSAQSFKKLNKYQRRVTVIDTVYPGKPTIIDSEAFVIENQRLQELADSSKKSSLIQPGKSLFSQNLVGAELDRLVTLYRKKGYFLITRDNLIAEVDTVDQSLLNFTLDPFEQAQKLAQAAEHKKGNPTAVMTVKKRENTDTTLHQLPNSMYFKPYTTGNIYYYPEANINMLTDSLIKDTANLKADRYKEYTMYYSRHLFYLTLLRNLTTLRTGRLYSDDNLSRTINNFNQLPAWRQMDYRTRLRGDSVDFYFFMSPARPGNVTLSWEGTYNEGDFLSTGSLVGTAISVGYTAPNLFKSAVQYAASFTNGVEFTFNPNYPFLQTFLSSLNNTFSIPNKKVWTPFNGPIRWLNLDKHKPFNFVDNQGTEKISLTGSLADRYDFFRLQTVVLSHGFEWRKKNTVWQLKFPGSIEAYYLDTLPLLDSAFKQNPFLRTSFNTGTVLSLLQVSATTTRPGTIYADNTLYYRLAMEESGAIADVFTGLQDKIYRYIKFQGELRKQYKLRKSAFALRAFGGIGINYGNAERFGSTLPFFKQFVAGGPNSMRAWGLRQLGLGSSVVGDTSTFNERYGDMQLETNVEYRFPIASFSAVNISSALFTDIGNIWNIHKNPALPGADFDISRLGKDIAVGVGTGLRLDFSYFLIRLDFGIKLKDPTRYENNGWLDIGHFNWQNRDYSQYGVRPSDNYAFQLGIGLPF